MAYAVIDLGREKMLARFVAPAEQLAFNPGPLVSLALLVTFIGLARAGVVGWWTVPAIIIGYAGMLFLPYSTPILPALGALPMLAVLALAGWRTIVRVRTRTAF